MGSYVSSCSTIISATSRAAKVIFPGGEVSQFRRPIKAAELMMESSNNFVVNTKSLNIGKRFSALSADDDLEFGNIYIMFPMRRLNSLVTASDTAVLFMVANPTASGANNNKVRSLPESASASGANNNKVRSLPESASGNEISESSFDEFGSLSAAEFKNRLSMSRSRKPSLDTITEESVCSW